jgi:pantothenate kinase
MHTVSFAINYWSRGQVQGLFLRHEGYLGAIGAFLKGAEECGNSFLPNRFSSHHHSFVKMSFIF